MHGSDFNSRPLEFFRASFGVIDKQTLAARVDPPEMSLWSPRAFEAPSKDSKSQLTPTLGRRMWVLQLSVSGPLHSNRLSSGKVTICYKLIGRQSGPNGTVFMRRGLFFSSSLQTLGTSISSRDLTYYP